MKKSLFITGAGGFIGSKLLEKIDFDQYENIYCLGRTENDVIREYSKLANFTFLKADISEAATYKRYLKLVDTVIHLAALTGKAPRDEYFRINTEGTKILLSYCADSGVRDFIFISSIAANFINVEAYYYAQSKIEAEHLVKRSGIPYTILRPTIVIGRNSAVLGSFLKIARAPIVPIFGDGKNRVQPVYIDDLAECILHVIENSVFRGQTITVGGPEIVPLKKFIRILHGHVRDRKFLTLHLPVSPIRKLLLMLEKKYLDYLPFTAGQLASFTNDGIAVKNPCFDRNGIQAKNIEEMIQLSLISAKPSSRTFNDLKKECSILTDYLIRREPDTYVQEKYIQAHKVTGFGGDTGLFDSLLIKAANSNAFILKLADSYTSIFYKNAILRKKLLLVLAILECCDSTYRDIDRGKEGPVSIMLAQLAQKAFFFFFTLIAGLVFFFPLKLVTARSKNKKEMFDYD
jgi:nucleoside-diphosphate-sugar epimerase